jgi:hypothetical protein
LVLYNRTKLEEKLRRSSGLIVLIIQLIFCTLPDAGVVMEV